MAVVVVVFSSNAAGLACSRAQAAMVHHDRGSWYAGRAWAGGSQASSMHRADHPRPHRHLALNQQVMGTASSSALPPEAQSARQTLLGNCHVRGDGGAEKRKPWVRERGYSPEYLRLGVPTLLVAD